MPSPSTTSPRSAEGDLVYADDRGLFCPSGPLYVDPWKPVDLALITHAHADHARPGSGRYLTAEANAELLARRVHEGAVIESLPFGEKRRIGDAWVSFHPAGHVLGSAQVRIESGGAVWVVSGDYKRAADPTCRPFEVVPCDGFITEATFALPVYRWPDPRAEARRILDWWNECRAQERAAVLFCYALGKSQRVLAELRRLTDRPVYVHGAMISLTEVYRQQGIEMLETVPVMETPRGTSFRGELVMAPPSARGSTWMRRFGRASTGFVSGWMRLRGTRRQRSVDRGFVISDHADWPNLLRTLEETGARRVLTTHGYTDVLARFLREARGLDAEPLAARYEGESE
ncbi:MAG: ligase-associated DNA damage response exonuclease [Acidobacteriota bacterium]